ncbi:MAG: NAD(+) synthase [Planctomycetota bacterium]
MNEHGFVRVTAVSPVVKVADPAANVDAMLEVLDKHPDSDVVVFPELSITGYSCGDLFGQEALLDAAERELKRFVESSSGFAGVAVIGVPLRWRTRLYNFAAFTCGGEVAHYSPKTTLPNYHEFYEARRFEPAFVTPVDDFHHVPDHGGGISGPLISERLVEMHIGNGEQSAAAVLAAEICEELWIPEPPSGRAAAHGAEIILNLSASPEQVGKAAYRRSLVAMQSARCVAAYAYASAGPSESTTDVVFGGHCMIAENGRTLAEARPSTYDVGVACTADIDMSALREERLERTTFRVRSGDSHRDVAAGIVIPERNTSSLLRPVPAHPFVPADPATKAEHCEEIFAIQTHALAKRLGRLGDNWIAVVGVSGGLDSTLALLVAAKTCDLLEVPRSRITGVTMPGFGTTARTRSQADELMEHLGVTAETVDIRELCLKTFRDLGHKPFGIDPSMSVEEFQQALAGVPAEKRHDLTFENVQARVRTLILMSKGFVIGTGDMSEAALGWSTYNADHMSMYNPNCSVPKTLVRHLVAYVAEAEFDGPARETLNAVCDTPVSPELLPPGADGEIAQSTEATLGPYELHDFFLYHMIRHGATPRKILFLAGHADFDGDYTPEFIRATLKTFYTRFFASQYKRSCVPDGPKVGSVSLSPRGDWRMPSDADVTAWIRELDA